MLATISPLDIPLVYPEMPEPDLNRCVRLWIQGRLDEPKEYKLTSPDLASRTEKVLLDLKSRKESDCKTAETKNRLKALKSYIKRINECLAIVRPAIAPPAPPPPPAASAPPFAVLQQLAIDPSPEITFIPAPATRYDYKRRVTPEQAEIARLQQRIDILEADGERQARAWQQRYNEQLVTQREYIKMLRQQHDDALASIHTYYQDVVAVAEIMLDELCHHRYLKKSALIALKQRLQTMPVETLID